MLKKAMKKVFQTATTLGRNTGTIAKNMSQVHSSVNKYAHYMAKDVTGKSIPIGRSRSVIQAKHEKMQQSFIGRGVNKLKKLAVDPALNAMGRSALVGGAMIGAAGMVGISMMNGMMSRAQDIAADRYMRDSRYSSRNLAMTNLGQSSGTSTMNIGNHAGLSLAMYKGRHG